MRRSPGWVCCRVLPALWILAAPGWAGSAAAASLRFESSSYTIAEDRGELRVTLILDVPECDTVPEATVVLKSEAVGSATADDFDEIEIGVPLSETPMRSIVVNRSNVTVDDEVIEGPETFALWIEPGSLEIECNGTEVVFENPVAGATVVIEDDEDLASLTVDRPAVTVDEGKVARFSVSLQGEVAQPVQVSCRTRGSAQAGRDYLQPACVAGLALSTGNRTAEIEVRTLDDDETEPRETVTLELTAQSPLAVPTPIAVVVTINDLSCPPGTESILEARSDLVQEIWPGNPQPAPLVVHASACDSEPLSARAIAWQVSSGGVEVVTARTVTDGAGDATYRVPLRDSDERVRVRATLEESGAFVDFTLQIRGADDPPFPGACDDRAALTPEAREFCEEVGPKDVAPVADASLECIDAGIQAVADRIRERRSTGFEATAGLPMTWFKSGSGSRHQDESEGRPFLSYDFKAFNFGLDFELPGTGEDAETESAQLVVLGAALSYAEGRGELGGDGGWLKNQDLSFAVYGLIERWLSGDRRRVRNVYGYGMLLSGWSRYRLARVVDVGGEGSPRVATGRPRGELFGAALGGGLETLVGPSTIGGFGGLRYGRAGVGRYREHGAGDLDLIIRHHTAQSWQANVGLSLRHDAIALPLPVSLDLRLSYLRELSGGARRLVGQFVTQPENTITEIIGARDEDAFAVDVLVLLRISKRSDVHLSYRKEIDRDNERSEALQVGLSIRPGKRRSTR